MGEVEPPPKRPKILRGEDDYLPGSIVEIELCNIMTFDSLKCKPNSRLNLVIGPNGSGKSSLVCAIALGLGGEPQLLGRASSIGAYVKRGEDSGHIKISLRGNNEELIGIMRKINTQNKSEWLLNGKVVPKKDVLGVIQRFNIQVNNLTQFLPQDRVCEFAKLSPVQLLHETEKAVGDPQLPLHHNALIEESHKLKTIERTVAMNGVTLDRLKTTLAEKGKDVKRVRQREELLEKAEFMKKKVPWLKYDMIKAEYMEAKNLENDAKNKLNEAAKSLNDMKEPVGKKKREKATRDAECKRFIGLMSENAKKRQEISEIDTKLEVQVQSKHKEIEELKRQEASRQQRILQAKEALAAAKLELESVPIYEAPKSELDNLRALLSELEQSGKHKRLEQSDSEKNLRQLKVNLRQCVDRLTDMESTKNKLLHALKNSGADKIIEAYNWLQDHQNELHKEVYGPVLIEVKISHKAHADYLEGHVPHYIWKSFITQDPRDRDFLVKNLRSFDIPVLNYVPNPSHSREPFHITEQLSALGICSRLDQIFDAPEAVKDVLISQSGLEHSYIGTRETDQRADEVSRLGVFDFWTPDNHYRWSRSRYGGHISGSVEPVSGSRLLLCSSDGGEIERLRLRKKELEESISKVEERLMLLQNDIREKDDEASKLHKKREQIVLAIQQEKKKRQELVSRVENLKKKLSSLKEEDDLDISVAKHFEQAAGFNAQRCKYALQIQRLLRDAMSLKRSYAEEHLANIEFDLKIREMESNLKEHEKFALQASTHLEYCKKEAEDHRQKLSAAKKHAESIAVITPELEKAFLEMPTTLEELEAAIQDNFAHANSILFLNPNIVSEYENCQRQMKEIGGTLEVEKRELSRCLAEIDGLKEKWLSTLRNIVSQINKTFSWNFQQMAVAGEVSLDERGSDFDEYGILIKVKFRQSGQLQVLSAHHQSGGERSVSTILYLVSLQDLTNCPFRVVDEINQGMDPINERKMFQQLVRAASQPNTPQCFLLTPKLLPDLEYSEACSILNIMNGPWIEQPSKVWSAGGRWGEVMGLISESPS